LRQSSDDSQKNIEIGFVEYSHRESLPIESVAAKYKFAIAYVNIHQKNILQMRGISTFITKIL